MSSKFFTWTKGDRRNATEALQSGGVVPIPVECLKIKGMDYARSAKSKHHGKPLPLPLGQQTSTSPPRSSRTTDSIALHDAAVQSATSLMAVMNDMLRSPQLSAHMSSQRQSDIVPGYARPRSHTAPSTPMVEAPSYEPVELPGSLLLDHKKSHLSLPYPSKNSSDTVLVRPRDAGYLGHTITRPHSSPRESHGPAPFDSTLYTVNTAQEPHVSGPSASDIPRSWSVEPYEAQRHQASLGGEGRASAVNASNDGPSIRFVKRPSLSVMQPRNSVSPNLTASLASSRDGSSTVVPQTEVSIPPTANEDVETALLKEIAHLRAAQDAHIRSLKEAHENELACHRSYIDFLERRRIANASASERQTGLSIDTSQSGSRADLHSIPSATTLKSVESGFDSHKRASQEAIAEVEALKRKLSLCKKAQLDAADIQRERDHLRDMTDRSERRIVQLKDIIRKAKDNEKALRVSQQDLEARLVEANNERMDVLEGFHDACNQVRTANERERRLAQELDEVRERKPYSRGPPTSATGAPPDLSHDHVAKHTRALSDAGTWATTPPRMDPTMRQLTEARRMLAAKDARIKELERATAQHVEQDEQDNTQQKRLDGLEIQLEEQKRLVSAAQSDAERYNSLLHNELRRQAKHASRSTEKRAPEIEAEAFVIAMERTARLRSRASTNVEHVKGSNALSAPLSPEASAAALAATLEKELEYCVKEIVMYKLDVKGYRKDLKKANAEIEALRATNVQCPPTPDRDSLSSVRSQKSEAQVQAPPGDRSQQISPNPHDSGLGITLPLPPRTPTKSSTIAAATAAALASPPPTSPPPPRSKMPLNAHKKLPKPPAPSRTPSPLPKPKWPEQDISRTETLRSVSESIISSYAKRNQAHSEVEVKEARSEPLGTMTSPVCPHGE